MRPLTELIAAALSLCCPIGATAQSSQITQYPIYMVAICSDIDALLQWYNGLTTHGNIHKFPEGCEHNYHYDELPVGEFAAMRFIGGKVVIINRIRTTKGGKSITAYRIASAGTGDEV